MATKTISIDLEAYEGFRAARLSPNESFSHVIKRAHWRNEAPTAAALLDAPTELPTVSDDVLARLDERSHWASSLKGFDQAEQPIVAAMREVRELRRRGELIGTNDLWIGARAHDWVFRSSPQTR